MPNNHSTLRSLFKSIALAIRAKGNTTASIKADDFPDAINAIQTGSNENVSDYAAMMQMISGDYTPAFEYSRDVDVVERWALDDGDEIVTLSLPKCKVFGMRTKYLANLVSVYLPNVITISGGAFYNCQKLETVVMPEVELLDTTGGYGAFADCISLKSVDFNKAVDLTRYTFYYCTKLSQVTFRSTVLPSIDTYCFSYTPMMSMNLIGMWGSIYVLPDMIPQYKAAFPFLSSRFAPIAPNP